MAKLEDSADKFLFDEAGKKRSESILAHLDKFGTVNKDVSVPQPKKMRMQGAGSIDKQKKKFRFKLDLHGYTGDESMQMLRSAIERCLRSGITEMLIIHGHGVHSNPAEGPVLKRLVHQMLDYELALHIASYADAPQNMGGGGATLAQLRHTA